jgi:hypothetical protein
MLWHPGAQPKFRIPIAGRGIDVVDAVFEEDLQGTICLFLRNPGKSGGSEDRSSAFVPGTTEWLSFYHVYTLLLGSLDATTWELSMIKGYY